MKKKNSYITITDQFCGAGGSSQGARNYSRRTGGGVEIKLALNHWRLAIDTHQTNFPDTDHDCTDISASDPRRYSPTDILITSPECTNHSLAKGQKIVKAQLDLFDKGILDPAAERSRATMWDVCRFAEFHSYNCIIVENVVDARKWVMWEAWLQAMHLLGYNHKCCYFNSMHFHPTPQSRDRMYIVFWKKGNKAPDLDYQPIAHCHDCGHNVHAVQSWKKHRYGKFKTQYTYRCPVHHTDITPYYYAAFNAIDWTDIGSRIGDRKKPLADNTVRRIQYGLDKYCTEPFLFRTAYGGSVQTSYDPLNTQTTQESTGLAIPFVVNDQQRTGVEFRVKSASGFFSTVTTSPNFKLIMPMIINTAHAADKHAGKVFKASTALPSQTTLQGLSVVVPPLFVPIARGKSKAKRIEDPLTTQSQMINHGVVTTESWNSFISYYYGSSQASSITDPLGTTRTGDCYQLISYKQPLIEDCFYRMIKPPEIKKAMAFDHDYIVLGSGKDQVKQCGNAVTPPVMEWLIQQCVESLS